MGRESGLLLLSRLNESLTPPNSRPPRGGYAELEASQILKFVPAGATGAHDQEEVPLAEAQPSQPQASPVYCRQGQACCWNAVR